MAAVPRLARFKSTNRTELVSENGRLRLKHTMQTAGSYRQWKNVLKL